MSTPATDWAETVAPDEATRFEQYGQVMQAIQARRDRDGTRRRALHSKGVAGVEAEFTVRSDIPSYAKVGIFASPGSFKGWVRFSNGAVAVQSDRKGDIRGMALKLVGVPGKKVLSGTDDPRTQDFLMIQSPHMAFRNSDEFIYFVQAATSPLTLLPKLIGRMGFGRTFSMLGSLRREFLGKVPTLAALRFYTPVPIRFGAYAAKYSARPTTDGAPARTEGRADFLYQELADRLARGALTYEFGAQFYVDATKTPIEDPTVTWSESDAPFRPLATLTLPQQDLRSDRGRAIASFVEKLAFDPWHAPEEFRPLGDMMRARKVAYYASTQKRETVPEPDGTESF
jgi:hypothetical protein